MIKMPVVFRLWLSTPMMLTTKAMKRVEKLPIRVGRIVVSLSCVMVNQFR